MALNKYMHPRNLYKDKAPNFRALAEKYPEFANCVFKDLKGKCHLDYKSPTSLRQLAIALLKEDFDLEVEMPLNRLIPTIPLRLNYILWIEDILKELSDVKGKGIDIGTGATCVYPLLGCKKNGWEFLASEVDETNFTIAEKNIQRNKMQEKIKVKKVSGKTALLELLEGNAGQFDFCMCNPPFFADHMEAQAITSSRSDDRAEPSSINTASVGESITEGGEAEFIKKIIVESVDFQGKIKIFTSMIGKKTNIPLVKKELRDHKIPNYQTTEFCQGKTMRWGIAWTFDTSVTFPRSLFQDTKKSRRLAVPLTFVVPQSAFSVYDVEHVANKVEEMLKVLQIENVKSVDSKTKSVHLKLTAFENTWSHQRRKRRELKRRGEHQTAECTDEKKLKVAENFTESEVSNKQLENSHEKCQESPHDRGDRKITSVSGVRDNQTFIGKKIEETVKKSGDGEKAANQGESSTKDNVTAGDSMSVRDEDQFLVKCDIFIKNAAESICMEMVYREGQKDQMHQILQYLKNHIDD